MFQNDRLNDQLKDNSQFDHSDVKNIWFEFGRRRYPEESWNLDFNNDDYLLAYDTLQNYKPCFFKADSSPYIDSIPFVNKKGFKTLYPMYSINLVNQPKISQTKR